MKFPSRMTLAALALVLAASARMPSNAQQSAARALREDGLQHIQASSMSPSDEAELARNHRDLVEAAEIYGYRLTEGNWAYRQTICDVMPDTILLQFSRQFPDGSESLFTALLPRGAGRVRIVPALYRNATPYLPAARNPRNYALFNEFADIASQGAVSNRRWIELSACYAEMTGATIDPALGSKAEIGIAGAPSPTIHATEQRNAIVTFATREGESSYKLWSISFDRHARVVAAETEDRSVYTARSLPQTQITPAAEMPPPDQQAEAVESSERQVQPQTNARAQSSDKKRATENVAMAAAQRSPSSSAAEGATAGAGELSQSSDEPGWKSTLHPAAPPSKLEPTGPPPPERIVPQPSDSIEQSTTADQPPQ